MGFSFTKLFKRKGSEPKAPPALAPVAALAKPSSDRFSKTVLPNTSRVSPQQDPFVAAASSSTPIPATITLAPPRAAISMNAGTTQRPHVLPPAVAVALDPKIERTLPFTLADVVAQMPPGFTRPLAGSEGERRVLLKAAEVERGMSNGRPTISVVTIHDQVPEIFIRPVVPSDETQVPLPFLKVLEQFTSLQMRTDQYREQAVPQVETPFLKVTLEDDSKFGTTTGVLTTDALPPVRLEPATAEAIAAAEPEAVAQEKFVLPTPAPLRNGHGPERNGNGNGLAAAAAPAAAPTRIPFSLTPTGAGAPAAERVPASCGGVSVPTSAPASPGPTRIPFKLSAAAAAPAETEERSPVEPWLTKDSFPASGQAAPKAAAPTKSKAAALKVSLPLKPILASLPPFQVKGDVSTVPDDARAAFPVALLEPQLATGRVTVTPDEFAAALPEEFRSFFTAEDIAAPVSLPLQDVLKNLPSTALRMRDDQEEQERGANYATPFAAKADEDAKRHRVSSAPVPKPELEDELPALEAALEKDEAAPLSPEVETETMPVEEASVAAPERSALQRELETDDSLDPKTIVACIEKLAGVDACALMFGDGLNLAGQLPDSFNADALCAMAPSMMQRIDNHVVETNLGPVRALTLSCTEAAVSFFMHENLCLAALHAQNDLTGEVRERLDRIVRELSKMYSQPA